MDLALGFFFSCVFFFLMVVVVVVFFLAEFLGFFLGWAGFLFCVEGFFGILFFTGFPLLPFPLASQS